MGSTLFLLPVEAMVLSAKDIVLDTEPEEGKAAEMAAAVYAIESARGKALADAKEAEKTTETAEMAREKAEGIKTQNTLKETLEENEKTVKKFY